ncbi:MAG: FtsX-like permease family protein [Bacteroidales bacterium]|nr:FtsX-like permease family protein [Bacteroidales bacterium]
MDTIIKIAWRDLWRNKRRTFITMGSIMMAVFLAMFMRSMQIGSYDNMILAGVTEVGYLQVYDSGYWNNKSINKSLVYTNALKKKINNVKNISRIIPRLELFALGSFGNQTKGIFLIGTDPEIEDQQTHLSRKIVKGRYLKKNDSGILLAEKLAKFLKADVNDTIVILGQGYQGITAAGKYKVVGILKFLAKDRNNKMIYMGLSNAQNMISPYVPDVLSSLSIMLDKPNRMKKTRAELQKALGNDYEVITWRTILSEMVQTIQGDNAGGIIMLLILYIVVGFGIFGTVLMMTLERKKEFAVMVSVGMRRSKLSLVMLIETFVIGLMGVLSGIALSLPLLVYLHYNPIGVSGEIADMMIQYNMVPAMPASLKSYIFINQGITVLILALIASLYPVIIINRFKILRALRG